MFYIQLALKRPYGTICWSTWKTERTHNKLAAYIGTKNKTQVKSYDQREKNKHKAEK